MMLMLGPQGSQSLASVSTLAGVGLGWDVGTFPEMDAGMNAGAGTRMAKLSPTCPNGLCPVLLPIQPGLKDYGSHPRCQDMFSHNHGMLEGALKIIPSSP